MPPGSTTRNLLLRGLREVLPADAYRVRLRQRRFTRPDVSLAPVAGTMRYVVERTGTDALDAYQHNLDTVRRAIDVAGIHHFVVKGAWGERPIIGILRPDLPSLWAQLQRCGAGTPTYAAPTSAAGNGTERRVEASEPPAETGRFCVFSFLSDPASQRRFGIDEACCVELWDEQPDGSLVGATRFVTTRRHIPAAGREQTVTVDVYGREMVTHPPLDGLSTFAVDFPVDVVYMWVDGADPDWQSRKAERLGLSPTIADDAAREARYRQFDELRYSLRSLDRFAPWVRRVYLVTDRQRPEWLREEGTNLTVVDHTEIMPAEALPTYNSHAITASLHRIPALSDRFVLFNDDVFLGRPVGPEHFFEGNGTCRFFLSRTSIDPRPAAPHEAARLHTCDLIEQHTGVRPARVMKHTPVPLNRELLANLEREVGEPWHTTVHSPFRSPDDIVPSYLHHYLGYRRGLTTPGGSLRYGYFGFGSDVGMADLELYSRARPVHVFCVNDLGGDPSRLAADQAALRAFLERELPHPSRYE